MDLAEKILEEELPAPGSALLTTFTLKRAEIVDNASGPVCVENPSDLEISSMPSGIETNDFASIMTSLKFKQRPWILYDQFQSEREPNVKQRDMSLSPKVCLPKGVIRGCSDCSGCQKVSARWNPAGACTYLLKDAIVFHPTEEDFKDVFKYIDSIRPQVEPYGLCRIVPPSSWKLPIFLEEDDIWQNYKFSTKVQRVHELQNQSSYWKTPLDDDTRKAKRRRLDHEFSDACAANFSSDEGHGSESFEIEPGPEFSLIGFKRYADEFLQHYFSRDVEAANDEGRPTMHEKQREPSVQNIEGEYWRIVEKPTEEIEVLYGTNVLSERLGCSSNSGQASDSIDGSTSNWDPSHLYKLPGSLLSFETLDCSSIIVPQLHIGMCFSCLPWTVEGHHLYKLQYLHLGAPRIWYGTPGSYTRSFEGITKKKFPVSDEHIEKPVSVRYAA